MKISVAGEKRSVYDVYSTNSFLLFDGCNHSSNGFGKTLPTTPKVITYSN
jgi:hypothetical protein